MQDKPEPKEHTCTVCKQPWNSHGLGGNCQTLPNAPAYSYSVRRVKIVRV